MSRQIENQLSRRSVITAGVGAVIGFPTIVHASVLGRGGFSAPSNRITVGMIGTGKMANDFHLPTLIGFPDVQILAVCDVDTTRRVAAQKRVTSNYDKQGHVGRQVDIYNDFRDIIARKDIDAVCIATPEHWHAIPIIEAAKAGKDIYCEKPMTLTLLEAKRCIDAVRKHKRVMQTGSQQRSNVFGDFRQACEFIRSGRIGDVKKVTVGVGGPSRRCDLPGETLEPGLDWDMWLGPTAERPYSSVLSPRGSHDHFPAWRNYSEFSGGGHADIGAHMYDIMQWALGTDASGPVSILPSEDPSEGQGVKFIMPNGIEITHGGASGVVFTGTRGMLRVDRGVLFSDPKDLIKDPLADNEVHLFQSPGHHRNWLDCIKSRQRCLCDVEIGARSNQFTQLGNLAYWHGRKLTWDPIKWEFPGDKEASTWMDYERRPQWKLPKG